MNEYTQMYEPSGVLQHHRKPQQILQYSLNLLSLKPVFLNDSKQLLTKFWTHLNWRWHRIYYSIPLTYYHLNQFSLMIQSSYWQSFEHI